MEIMIHTLTAAMCVFRTQIEATEAPVMWWLNNSPSI